MNKTKTVLLSVVWTIVMLIFPVGSGVIVSILEMDQVGIFLTQGLFMLVSLAVPAIYLGVMKITAKDFGLSTIKKKSARGVLFFIPAVLAELPLLFAGVDFVGVAHTAALVFFALAVGISEEIYFRGVILRLLEKSFSDKQAVVISGVVFGLGHFASIFAAESITSVLLQIFNAVVFGIVAAEIVMITKSLFPVMIWHFFFNYMNHLTLANGTKEIIVITIQETIMILYAVYLWVRLWPKRKE